MPSAVRYWPASLVIAVPVGIYAVFLGLCASPWFQRNFLYAHKVHTLLWTDLNKPEKWGFAKNQVTPFHLTSEDGETLYAWHILPLPLYSKHENELSSRPTGFSDDFTKTKNFELLKNDADAKLVVYLHGNAGHVAQGIRPDSYHALTDTSGYHVLAVDYRGFGHSTGSPTEAGVILDATAAIDFALGAAGVPPSRLALLSQSLGTAVASAAAEHYARRGVDFAGVVLVSAFADLAGMLSDYAIAGWVPVLRPLRAAPWLLRRVLAFLADTWNSADRLAGTVRAVKARGGRLRIELVHAANDWDIPCHEDDRLFAAAVRALASDGGNSMDDQALAEEKDRRTVGKGKDAFVATWREGAIEIRQELFPYGGHNDIMMYAPVTLAVMRAFDLAGTAEQSTA